MLDQITTILLIIFLQQVLQCFCNYKTHTKLKKTLECAFLWGSARIPSSTVTQRSLLVQAMCSYWTIPLHLVLYSLLPPDFVTLFRNMLSKLLQCSHTQASTAQKNVFLKHSHFRFLLWGPLGVEGEKSEGEKEPVNIALMPRSTLLKVH